MNDPAGLTGVLPTASKTAAAWLAAADGHFERREFAEAWRAYSEARSLAPDALKPRDYFRASLAGWRSGRRRAAFDLLDAARAAVGESRVSGAMWYNLGCFAAQLGRPEEAVRALNRAVDRGYADPAKYRTDPDLEPVRCRADFRRLLGSIRAG